MLQPPLESARQPVRGGVIVRPPLLRAKIRPATQRLTSGRDKVRPARHLFGVCETKFALQGQNPEKWAIFGEQGEFCLGSAAEGGLLGEFCTGEIAKKACRESFVPEALLKAVTVSVSMCGRSPCDGRSSTGGPISHAIPLKAFQVLNSNR